MSATYCKKGKEKRHSFKNLATFLKLTVRENLWF